MNTYLIFDPGSRLLKIGKAACVKSRLKSLQTGCGSILEIKHVFDCDIEDILHIEYEDFRKHGEWFDINFEKVVSDCKNKKHLIGCIEDRKTKHLNITPKADHVFSKAALYLLSQNKWIESMNSGDEVSIPEDQLLTSTKKLCKEYGLKYGKRFQVISKRNIVRRIA